MMGLDLQGFSHKEKVAFRRGLAAVRRRKCSYAPSFRCRPIPCLGSWSFRECGKATIEQLASACEEIENRTKEKQDA